MSGDLYTHAEVDHWSPIVHLALQLVKPQSEDIEMLKTQDIAPV